jgi:hypothetical protein
MDIPKNVMRTGEQGLWSTFLYQAAANVAGRADPVFTVAVGNQGQGFGALSVAETNMKESGRIAGGQAYDVFGVALQPYYIDEVATNGVFAINGADLRNIDNNLVLIWRFLQVFIEIAPASLIGAGGGIYGATADTANTYGNAGDSGVALNHGAGQVWVYRQHPVLLPANTTFSMLYNWGDLASPVSGQTTAQLGLKQMALRTVLLGRFQSAVPIA